MKIALITGASTGIGKISSIEMAKVGYHVYLVARSEEKLSQVKTKIENQGGKATIINTDLSSLESVNSLIEKVRSEVENIDAIVNIAGVWHGKEEVYAGKDFESFNRKTILDTYTVGFTAHTILIHGLLSKMKENSSIVNLSGTFENGGKGWIPYFASKRALEDLTVGLADELRDKQIKVNCVSPSDTATEEYKKFFPQYIEEAIDPLLVANKIVELCDEFNSETGKVIVMKKDTKPYDGFHS